MNKNIGVWRSMPLDTVFLRERCEKMFKAIKSFVDYITSSYVMAWKVVKLMTDKYPGEVFGATRLMTGRPLKYSDYKFMIQCQELKNRMNNED